MSMTPGMIRVLEKMKIDYSNLTYGQSLQLVREQIRRWKLKLASGPQIQLLKKFYNDLDWRNLKFDDASKMINALKANGWRRPPKGNGA